MGFKVLNCSKNEHISVCVSTLREGGVIVFPTDTVYGIGCSPYCNESVERIFDIKGRSDDKPLPVMGSNINDIENIVDMSFLARALAQNFWPGALTIVAPCKDKNISKKVMAGDNTLAVRVPNNTCAQTLLGSCKYLIGTSANISGTKPCISPADILSSGLSGFDILLDGGVIGSGIESTVVEVIDSAVRILREGAIASGKVYNVIFDILGETKVKT